MHSLNALNESRWQAMEREMWLPRRTETSDCQWQFRREMTKMPRTLRFHQFVLKLSWLQLACRQLATFRSDGSRCNRSAGSSGIDGGAAGSNRNPRLEQFKHC